MDKNLSQAVDLKSIAKEAHKMLHGKHHAVGRLLVIDYEVRDSGEIHLHIFPNVPDHDRFYPNNQAFAKLLEDTVRTLVPTAEVQAEFHEEEGTLTDYDEEGRPVTRIADTRVKTYYRDPEGNLTKIMYPKPVPMVWLGIVDIPGSFYPREKTARALAEAIIASSEKIS